jgi:hypothetical protein
MRREPRRTAPLVASLVTLCLLAASAAQPSAAQFRKREYLTQQEVESVRAAQELDKRTSIFIRIIERRMKLLAGEQPPAAAPVKLETGEVLSDALARTRPELLSDIALALDEAIENIDDTASRAPQSSLIGKSTKRLAEASQKFLQQLTPLRAAIHTGPERESLEQAVDNLQQIIDAVKKVKEEPAEDKTKKKP